MHKGYEWLEPLRVKAGECPKQLSVAHLGAREGGSHAGDTASHTAQSALSVSSVAYGVFTCWDANPIRIAGLVSRSSCKVGDAPLQAEDETPPLCLTRAFSDATPLARDVKPW